MRLGGRCHDRIYHVDRSDVTHFGFFLNSSLALVLRFRSSFVSVCNFLRGIRLHGFSDARVDALWSRWRAVVRLGPNGPVTSFDPWTHWIPPDLHGFYKWASLMVDLEQAFAFGRGVLLSSTCQFQLDEDKGSRRDFLLACPIALAAASACSVLPDRWFAPHFAVCAEFALSAWDAIVDRARTHSPLWPACWLECPDRSRSSQSHEVQHIWDVYIREVGFVPLAVREQLFRLCNSPDVDSSWLFWSREAEASLARAYLVAGGPPLSNPSSYVGRGSLSIETMRLGGRCHDRIYHVDRADQFDVTHSGFFLNSSLAPVLRFRRSFVSVCNVLKGIKLHGFSESRVAALWSLVGVRLFV